MSAVISSDAFHTMEHGRRASQSLAQGVSDDLAHDWQEFILRQFGTDIKAITTEFSVSKRTAEYWLKGEIAPRGCHVYRAARLYRFGLDT